MDAVAPAICRDCQRRADDGPDRDRSGGRCPACGSPRLLTHPELDRLAIAHVDCDAFFAAVEKRDDPALADRPVIVGGGKRGVVMTACYIARINGVRSAMPMFKALQACPQAVIVRPNMAKYAQAGREVRRLMGQLTPLVEPVSIDEAFLDMSGTDRVHRASPAASLVRLAAAVESEVGISISVGLSFNKFLAKLASDQDKPRGFAVIGRGDLPHCLDERPVGTLPGVGPRARTRLEKGGVVLVRHLRERPLRELQALFGRDIERLIRLASGDDSRAVSVARTTRGLSAETTFSADLSRADELEPILWRLAEKVSGRLKGSGQAGRSVVLKLKDSRFRILTRTRSGLPPTQLAARLFAPARAMLHETLDGRAFRLVGVGASDLCSAEEADRGDLADATVAHDTRVEAAVDRIRERFGDAAVQKGLAFPFPQR